jgi:hypothetical protein
MTLRAHAVLVAIFAGAVSTASAQRQMVYMPYDAPAFSPWIAVDAGMAVQYASCDCRSWYGGPGLGLTGAVGVTIHSRLALGAEQTSMVVTDNDNGNVGRLRAITARALLINGLYFKGGIGRGRYTNSSHRLVPDRLAWLAALENCGAGRTEICLFAEYSRTANGPVMAVDGSIVRYQLRSARMGLTIRRHLRDGE